MCFNEILDDISKLHKVNGVGYYRTTEMCCDVDTVAHRIYADFTEIYRKNKQFQTDNHFRFCKFTVLNNIFFKFFYLIS